MEKVKARLVSWGILLALVGILVTTSVLLVRVAADPASAAPVLYDEQAVVALFEKANPAVVKIDVTQATSSRSRFAIPQGGQGSGFLVDAEGHILTNYHVVQGAASIKVMLEDGRTLDATVAGTSPADDIALIKVDAQAVEGIAPLPLGDSSAVKPGQMAVVLGSPYGLDNSITVGVVSGVDRTRTGILSRPITGMIQTDASMNPGNSGGPVLNSLGEVVGISTSIETSINGATGIGFAVPINTAKELLAKLMENATMKRPWLGIRGMAVTPALRDMLGLTTAKGVYVTEVTPNSPAQEVGLIGGTTGTEGTPIGDVITAVDGRAVESVENLVSYFNTLKPGDEVTLTILRGGATLSIRVVLGEWPDSFQVSPG